MKERRKTESSIYSSLSGDEKKRQEDRITRRQKIDLIKQKKRKKKKKNASTAEKIYFNKIVKDNKESSFNKTVLQSA